MCEAPGPGMAAATIAQYEFRRNRAEVHVVGTLGRFQADALSIRRTTNPKNARRNMLPPVNRL